MSSFLTTTRLTFIGAGNMAQALAGGLIAKAWPPRQITLTDINQAALDQVSQTLGVNTSNDNAVAVSQADVVVLAVKPQVLDQVVGGFADALAHQPLVISIAAGITTAQLTRLLGYQRVVRVMPNTPALVQTGAAGLFAASGVSDHDKQLATQILESAGIALWFDNERHIDAVTAVSGSGPAYFFLLMESMISAAQALGLDVDSATRLVLQTAQGAATLAQQSADSPATLRQKVTSPNGTTAAAIASFEQDGFAQMVNRALTAACDRSIELSRR